MTIDKNIKKHFTKSSNPQSKLSTTPIIEKPFVGLSQRQEATETALSLTHTNHDTVASASSDKEEQSVAIKAYLVKSHEKILQYGKRYREQNKEKKYQYNKKYRQNNKEKKYQYNKKYRQNNKEILALKEKEYRQKKKINSNSLDPLPINTPVFTEKNYVKILEELFLPRPEEVHHTSVSHFMPQYKK